MAEIIDFLGSQSIWLSLVFGVISCFLAIFLLRKLIKPAFVSLFDPMYVGLVFIIGPALGGLFLFPYLMKSISETYVLILIFFAVFLLIIRGVGRPKRINLRDRMSADFQMTLLAMSILAVCLNVVFNMIIPGTIPLFTTGGVYLRSEATQNSRLLYWCALGLTPMPGLIYAVTEKADVRRLAVIAVIFGALVALLAANKAAILTIIFTLLNAVFIAQARNQKARAAKLKRVLLYCAVLVGCFIPLYFEAIGFGESGSFALPLLVRMIGGFDQLIFASKLDLLKGHAFGSLLHINLIEYQLMPLFKVLMGKQYEYSSVGQYIMETLTGNRIVGPASLPNSNLILETVMTSGRYFGFVLFVLESFAFYICRYTLLRKPVTPSTLLLLQMVVFEPYGLFLSGQEWFTETLVVLATVLVAAVLCGIFRFLAESIKITVAAHPA